jgi:hypothetical protein
MSEADEPLVLSWRQVLDRARPEPAPENHVFGHGMFERVMTAPGRQLLCTVTEGCGYTTSIWHVDDGSAEEEFSRHKDRVHQ